MNTTQETQLFKKGTLPILAALEVERPGGRKPLTYLWINSLGKQAHFQALRGAHLRFDGEAGSVDTTWKALLDPNTRRSSWVKLECVFVKPIPSRFSLLFTLPDAFVALSSIVQTKEVAIIPLQQATITEKDIERTIMHTVCSFEVPYVKGELKSWLAAYQLGAAFQGTPIPGWTAASR